MKNIPVTVRDRRSSARWIAVRQLALLALLWVCLAAAPAGRASSFTKVLDNTSLPDLGEPSSVSSDGTAVAFICIFNSSGKSVTAIYYVAGPGSKPVKIADTQTASPSGGGNFTELYPPVVSGSYVVFKGMVQTSETQNSGIYLGHSDGTLSIIADTNSSNPLDPTGELTGNSKLGGFVGYDIDGSNVVFTASDNVFKSNTSAAAPTALLPLKPKTPAGVAFDEFDYLKLAGSTYAVGGGFGLGSGFGLYTGSVGGGALTKIMDSNTAEPTGKGTFSAYYVNNNIGSFALSADGTALAFVGDVNDTATGLYYAVSTGGTISTVVLTGTKSPDGGTFGSNFGGIFLEADTAVDFVDDTGVGTGGIFASAPGATNDSEVLADRGLLDGLTVDVEGMESNGGSRFGFVVSYPSASSPSATFAVYIGSNGSAGAVHPDFCGGEIALGSGVYYLVFPSSGNLFGYYSYLSDSRYFYHFDMGYEYWFDAGDGKGGIYLYDFTSGHFLYSSPAFPFPYLYDFSLDAVLYYYPDTKRAGHYTTNPRYFYNFATHKIFTQ